MEVDPLFFEGSEKKVEIIVGSRVNLMDQPKDFWSQMVAYAGAKIISEISNEDCKAYLLSESSLFVWKDHLTMITCGTTTLVKAVKYFFSHFPHNDIETFIYERKNEYFPHLQNTNFFSDVKFLAPIAEGSSYRFGMPDEHHLMLFEMDKDCTPSHDDVTFELLMYNLQGDAKEILNSPGHTIDQVRDLLKFDSIFPGFQVDDYLFQPRGYSLNALKGTNYYTVHVTPEEVGSYVSFETNLDINETVKHQLSHILEIFKPESFDVIWFRPDRQVPDLSVPHYVARNRYQQALSSGYTVSYSSHFMEAGTYQSATKMEGLQK
ncbi:MAG: adenosylmethionine decarboxylase [Bdellovibrionales bacterium]|nr:adenosylmethionine decarboxylase [Bdellovibrionales bacterium]